MKRINSFVYSFFVICLICAAVLIDNPLKANSQLFNSDIQDKCGSDRWDEKTLSDKFANEIDLDNPVSSSVSKQAEFPNEDIKADTPRLSNEKTVYKIRCWLTQFVTEDDRDYHLVIKDEKTKQTMVAEICDPTCPGAKNSVALDRFVEVRNKFETYFAGKKSKKNIKLHIQIEGVGFYDLVHNGKKPTGNLPNNREIHPITKLTFLKS